MINYNVDQNGIYVVHFTGDIYYQNVLEWLNRFSELSSSSRKSCLIYDLTKAKLHLDMAAMLKVLEKTDEATVNYIQIRTAFVLNEENADNYAGLFSFLKPTIRAVRKAFVNYDDAYKWLIEEKEKTMFDEFDES